MKSQHFQKPPGAATTGRCCFGDVPLQRDLIHMSHWMEDKIVHRLTLNQYVCIVWYQPAKVVDRPISRQPTMGRTLNSKLVAFHFHLLNRLTNKAQVSQLFGKKLRVQFAHQLICALRFLRVLALAA